ncbi:Arc family DNA binding domain-containing protein [Elizabethkingia sp. JS20170427COW]|uniref:Arc family DNA binding domain-containing protein n=1 Tax=Elizabethkingia sp. JS20170427COW TaxID=2583851 RepID=UPI001110EB50|nr:Arc family DNA binding domain-containing protein [Elizabethkingia sp. JS20170427COW]QCX52622.1 Arc family DNA binding domain-containing protein [Elizabethkingia sp. JS20170427COW]
MANQKKSFVLRIDEATYKLLEKWASDEFRSVNGQVEFLLNQALLNSGRKRSLEDKTTTNTSKASDK